MRSMITTICMLTRNTVLQFLCLNTSLLQLRFYKVQSPETTVGAVFVFSSRSTCSNLSGIHRCTSYSHTCIKYKGHSNVCASLKPRSPRSPSKDREGSGLKGDLSWEIPLQRGLEGLWVGRSPSKEGWRGFELGDPPPKGVREGSGFETNAVVMTICFPWSLLSNNITLFWSYKEQVNQAFFFKFGEPSHASSKMQVESRHK